MSKQTIAKLLGTALLIGVPVTSATAGPGQPQAPSIDIGNIAIDADITLRHMVVKTAKPKGTVLLLHGFPETLYAWKGISLALADEYEVHAIDWPGFGQSSRPAPERFSYAPRDYARVLKAYIAKARIDRSRLVIYATDIGALPALLLALDEPGIARTIIVGDFAPFDRPAHMYESLQGLKSKPSSELVHAAMNANREEILENAFRRGLPGEAQFEVPDEYRDDMARGWGHGAMTSADAFYHYYSHFTRDQAYFEANLARLKTPVKVVWGEKDIYIRHEMGVEFAARAKAELTLLPGIGHYPHLQDPQRTVAEIRSAFR